MTTISEPAGCGNAPRHLIIRDLTVALAERNRDHLEELLTRTSSGRSSGLEGLSGCRTCSKAFPLRVGSGTLK
jgi:hypothetical protein